MRVPGRWQESKFVVSSRTGGLRGSRVPTTLGVSSRLITDRIGGFYSRAIREFAHGDLLDLGCGRAPLLGYYSNFVDSATLVDWGNSMHPNPLLDLVADLNGSLPLGDQSFDTVLLSDVLEHIAEPQSLIGEVSRVLRPGGILLLNVPFYYPIHEEPFDFFRFTRFALERMCTIAGLRVIEVSSIGGLPDVLLDLHAKLLQRVPLVGPGLAALVQASGGWLLRFGPGRFATARTAEHFPLGYSLVAAKLGSSEWSERSAGYAD